MTYEASTSLSIFLSTAAQSKKASTMAALIKGGLGINAASVVFTLTSSTTSAVDVAASDVPQYTPPDSNMSVSTFGDIMTARHICLDLSMWRLGGAAIPLRLVQLAKVSIGISRTGTIHSFSSRPHMSCQKPWLSLPMACGMTGRTPMTWSGYVRTHIFHQRQD